MRKKLAPVPGWHDFVPYALLAGAVFAAYAGVYHNTFLYDDDNIIVHNVFLRSWRNAPDLFTTMLMTGAGRANLYYRPLQTLLYLITFQMAGLSTVAFHLLNVGLHAANACLLLRLGRKLGFMPLAAFAAALLWAVHPVNTEAVTYMSATADVLQGLFCLLGITVLLPDFSQRRVMMAALIMIAGLLGKETVVVFPLLAASCVYLTSKKRFDWRNYVRLWPLAAVAAIYVALHALLVPHAPQAAAKISVAAVQTANFEPFAALPLLLRLFAWPAGLHMEHDMPVYASPWHIEVIAGFILVMAAVFFVLQAQTRKNLPAGWAVLWFFAAYAPVFLLGDKLYEHWLYLPSAGLLLGAVQSLALSIKDLPLQRAHAAHRVAFVAILIVVAGYASLTYAQNRIWHDAETFYSNTLAYGEAAPNFHVNLGVYYAQRQEYEKAIAQYQQAVAVKDSNALTPTNRAAAESDWGTILLAMPDSAVHADEALMHLNRAVEADPNNYPALLALSKFYAQQGNETKAESYRLHANKVRQQYIAVSSGTEEPK